MITFENKSMYARKFDSSCINWTRDREFNVIFLKTIQDNFNNILKAKGYVFLRDVYEKLGIPISKASIMVGWVYDENNPVGDNYIDFDIFSNDNLEGPDFILDFNVDGLIVSRFTDEDQGN